MKVRKTTKYIVVHTSATPPSHNWTVEDVRRSHVQRGFEDVGYHYVIQRNGTIDKGRAENLVGAHTLGLNAVSIGICMIGGLNSAGKPDCNYTKEQWHSLNVLYTRLAPDYQNSVWIGHRDASPGRACPCFDVTQYFKGGHRA